MRNHERSLDFSVFILVMFTSITVGIADGRFLPYVFTVPVAVLAYVVCRRWPRFQLKTLPANVLGLLAFALAGSELLGGSVEARLLSGAHLMVYLTWIVLLQKKEATQYWWLYALCIIQIAIGASLLTSLLYGFLLVVFLFLSIWSLSLFSLHRAKLRFQTQTSGAGEAAVSHAGDEVTSPGRNTSKSASPLLQPSNATGSIQDDADRRITTRFFGGIGVMVTGSVLVAFVLFLFVPRRWLGEVAWGANSSDKNYTTLQGFGEKVELGSFGTLLGSNERVMEVRLFDESGESLDVEAYAGRLGYDSPLFRGHVLEVYENGQWSKFSFGRRRRTRPRPIQSLRAPDSIRQEIRLAPIGSRVLFAMRPTPLRPVRSARIDGPRSKVYARPYDSVLLRTQSKSSRSSIIYEVLTRPASGRPQYWPLSGTLDYQRQCQRIPDRDLRIALQEILKQEIGLSGTEANAQARAQKIVAYLRDSGKFSYTLTIPRREHREIDPVLEFLRYRRTGHCEFYATALALLLRAAKIPSRLVSGFKGGQRNDLTGAFEVEQRHAHAWVEARIDQDWVPLDATPAARADSFNQAGNYLQSWRDFKNFVVTLWNTYVLEIEYRVQQKKLYDPLKKTAADAWNSVSQEREKSASGLMALKEFLSHPSRWFSWQGGLLSFVLMLFLVSLIWAVRKLYGLLRSFSKGAEASLRQSFPVAFYERFRILCESHGLFRGRAQTQREFADVVAARFSQLVQAQGECSAAIDVAAFPADLVTLFYNVRFGDGSLTVQQQKDIDRRLTQLEQSLSESNGRGEDSGGG